MNADKIPGESLWLSTVWVSLSYADLLKQPRLCELAVEDAVWKFSFADWRARRPGPVRRGAMSAWRAEGAALYDECRRLRSMAREYGVRARPATSG